MSIYDLPHTLTVQGKSYEIRSDFRACLDIICAYEDDELTPEEKVSVMLQVLFVEMPPCCEETIKTAVWFLDGGGRLSEQNGVPQRRLYLWNQDAPYIFSAVDNALGTSSRETEYLHWWVFLGGFMSMGDCTFANILHLRRAKSEGKLTKEEWKYWSENEAMLSLKTESELADIRQATEFLKQFE